MRRGWAFWVVVCLGLGCGAVVEPPEPSESLAVRQQESRGSRGATRSVLPVEGAVFGHTVGVDCKGNAFVGLSYEREGVDLGGGALPGEAGLALAKFAPDGRHLWSRGFVTYTGMRPRVTALTVDDAGNLYIAGAHQEPTLSLGGEPVPSGGFLAKYAPDGTHLWSHPATLPGQALLAPSALAVDEPRGHLVVAANFLDRGEPIGGALIGRVDVEEGLVLSVHPVVRWGRASVTALAMDSSGNLAVVGFFEGEVDLGGGLFSTSLPRSPFVARFTPDVRHLWSRGLGEAEGLATGVAVTRGRIVVVGEYAGGLLFRKRTRLAHGERDAFVLAYGPSGDELWMRHFAARATGVAVDGDDRVVVLGQYGPGDDAGGSRLPSHAGGGTDNHLFVVKLHRGSGGHEWSRGLFSDGVLRPGALALTRKGEAVLLSSATGTADIGTGQVVLPPDSTLLLRLGR